LINRVCNVFVSLFVMFWGLYYPLADAAFYYLTITGTIFLSGAFVCSVGGLYWKRANVTGGYMAMILGAVGAIYPFFIWHWSPGNAGFVAYSMAVFGLVIGSLIGKPQPAAAATPAAG
jgi:Na+/proline symporter